MNLQATKKKKENFLTHETGVWSGRGSATVWVHFAEDADLREMRRIPMKTNTKEINA